MKNTLIRTIGIWILLIPGVVALQPAFGGWAGFVPGLFGITCGCIIGWLAARYRLSLLYTVLVILGIYFLLGGAVALPRTTTAGVVPTLDTLRRLALLLWQSWQDLLTVATPAGDFTGPAVVPWLAGLIVGTSAATAVARSKAVQRPLLLPLAWLVFNIAFGVRLAPTALWLGVALGVSALTWVWVHSVAAQRNDNADILINQRADTKQYIRQAIAAVIVVGVAASGAIAATAATGNRVNRQVLRDVIAPPLNLRNYPSPLMSYRGMKIDNKDTTLFTVNGMPRDTRLRLAVMDTYDGNVFNVSQESNQYLRTGRTVTQDIEPNAVLDITVGEYNQVWVPLSGVPRRLEFKGEHAAVLADGTYYNRTSGQALATAELSPGDTVHLEVSTAPELTVEQRDALGAKNAGSLPLAKLSMVPEVLTTLASEYAEGADSAYAQVSAIEKKFLTEGYYSDGSDGKSRSGHTTERLSTMFRNTALIGDDEQYATAMAIMVNQLGVPARVVMGFYPDEYPGETWEVKGRQAHVWVEAYFADTGWVAFNPTPEREPQTEIPKPKPRPKPQVDPPPNPPEKLPEKPVLADQDAAEREGDDDKKFDWGLLYLIGASLGGLLLVSGPFLIILALKARRAARRKTTGELADRVAGGWDEVVDRARDLGYVAARSNTRMQAAQQLQTTYPEIPIAQTATRIDSVLFGPGPVSESVVEKTWGDVAQIKETMLHQVPWYRRLVARISLRSLRKPKVAVPVLSRRNDKEPAVPGNKVQEDFDD